MQQSPYQLQQVFLNIINNARQAIGGARPDGHLRVTTKHAGQNVQILFHDNGPGISPSNLGKIFNPFFTTKPTGKGTGLGLSVSYGIIQEHGGAITAQSRLGEGATFVIELPVLNPAGESAAAPGAAPASAATLHPAVGRVLVIDDEEPILRLIERTLQGEGLEVDAVPDATSALRLFREDRYSVILCDMKMPGLTGRQFYERIASVSPSDARRVIFMSGDTVSESLQDFLREHGRPFLGKPFSLADFRTAIRATLQR